MSAYKKISQPDIHRNNICSRRITKKRIERNRILASLLDDEAAAFQWRKCLAYLSCSDFSLKKHAE
jgi:hypothetical protein